MLCFEKSSDELWLLDSISGGLSLEISGSTKYTACLMPAWNKELQTSSNRFDGVARLKDSVIYSPHPHFVVKYPRFKSSNSMVYSHHIEPCSLPQGICSFVLHAGFLHSPYILAKLTIYHVLWQKSLFLSMRPPFQTSKHPWTADVHSIVGISYIFQPGEVLSASRHIGNC